MSDALEPNNNSHEYDGYYGITIPKEIYEAAQTLHIYFEKQMMQGWEFLSVADRRLITKLKRERDEAREEINALREENNRLVELLRRDEKPIWIEGARRGTEVGIDMAIKCLEKMKKELQETK